MKIKLKKQINENTYMKLSIKIDDYTLHDKFTKNEIADIVAMTIGNYSPKMDFDFLDEKGEKKC